MMKHYVWAVAFLLFLGNSFYTLGQVSVESLDVQYVQNFNTLATSGTANPITTLPLGWSFSETGSNADATYAAGTGSGNAGNTYSFGAAASTERALGGLQSGSLIPTIGVSFLNNTGSLITSLHITYTGEQWRLGTLSRTDRLDFQFSLNATSLTTGTWTDIDALDFTSPKTTGATGALIGNDPANRLTLSLTINDLEIPSGSIFSIRWTDFGATGADDGLSIDDFQLIASSNEDQPAISFSGTPLNFGEVNTGQSKTLSYSVKAKNLTSSINLTSSSPSFLISPDSITFSSSLVLPDSGGRVYVKFSPLADGFLSDTIIHSSTETTQSLIVTGEGFIQANRIIPISVARAQSIGTRVTVAGRITVANEFGGPSSIQDNTGGIPVFFFALSQQVEIGDSVIVTGPIGVFNDQKQISGSSILFTIADTVNRIIEPKIISLNELAANEGMLVTVQDVELTNKNFVFYPQSTETITNGSAQGDLRIDGDTNIPGLTKPQGVVDITGVVGRFRTNAQLMPRFSTDIPETKEPVTEFDSIPKSTTFDVVNWNVEFFGAEREDFNDEYGPVDEPLQLQNVKTVLNSLNADIIAVQEVSIDSTFAELVNALDGYFDFVCSDRYSHFFDDDGTFPPQKVCYIYNTATVNVVQSRAMFKSLYDSARLIDSSLLPGCPGGASSFWSSGRLPFLLTADVTINGVTERIQLVNIHAKSGAALADKNRRAYDVAVLNDTLTANFPNDKIIFLGDYNDDLDTSIAGGTTPYESFVADSANYLPITKSLSDQGSKSTLSFNDVIDHQIISNDLVGEFLHGSEQIIAPFRLIPNYGTTTSDHLPVTTRYMFEAPAISFKVATATVPEETSALAVTLTLSKPLATAKTISIPLSGSAQYGADFTSNPAASGNALSVTIPAGTDTVAFIIHPVNDNLDEPNETIALSLLPVEGIVAGAISSLTITIIDNDVPVIGFAGGNVSIREGTAGYPVRLTLSSAVATPQRVAIRVVNYGATYGRWYDYTTEPGVMGGFINLTIPADSSQVSFMLNANFDFWRELPSERVRFTISTVTQGLSIGTQKTVDITLLDAKKPKFCMFPNPTPGIVHLARELYEDPNEIIQVTLLYYGGGDLVYSGQGTVRQLNDVLTSKVREGRKGLYVIKVTTNEDVYWIRFLKI